MARIRIEFAHTSKTGYDKLNRNKTWDKEGRVYSISDRFRGRYPEDQEDQGWSHEYTECGRSFRAAAVSIGIGGDPTNVLGEQRLSSRAAGVLKHRKGDTCS